MKLKFLLPLIFGSLFSQNLSDINGYDWGSWDFSQKSGYINGFYGGLAGFEAIRHKISPSLTVKLTPFRASTTPSYVLKRVTKFFISNI